MRDTHVALALLASFTLEGQVWTQQGGDIGGAIEGEMAGQAISMPDAHTIAVGYPGHSHIVVQGGKVDVYRWANGVWVHKGDSILGSMQDCRFGYAVSMPDSVTLAVGAPGDLLTGGVHGYARVYSYNGSQWIQKGGTIYGDVFNDRTGYAVSMPDANTLAVGDPESSEGDGGHVRIYDWLGNTWTQRGETIYGEADHDRSGFAVSMPDANTIGIGATWNNGLAWQGGQVRVYVWNGSAWQQKGEDLNGDQGNDEEEFGDAVSMPDANTIAVGAWKAQVNGLAQVGRVRVFAWNGTSWAEKGTVLTGDAWYTWFGSSVDMTDPNTLAVGAWFHNVLDGDEGQVRVFDWDGTDWSQRGEEILGHGLGEFIGASVCMPDTSTVGVGGPGNYVGIGGRARVYRSSGGLAVDQNDGASEIMIYPNPCRGLFNIAFGVRRARVRLTLRNMLGEAVLDRMCINVQQVSFGLESPPGLYVLELLDERGHFTLRKLNVGER